MQNLHMESHLLIQNCEKYTIKWELTVVEMTEMLFLNSYTNKNKTWKITEAFGMLA